MKENSTIKETKSTASESVNLRELFIKYYIHWPWIAASVVACLIGAWGYLHYTTPQYSIKASIIIKDEKNGGGTDMAGLESLGLSGLLSTSKNIDNEIEMLSSETLVKEVVNTNQLYTTYIDNETSPATELYRTSPVLVNMPISQVENLAAPIKVNINWHGPTSMEVTVKAKGSEFTKQITTLPTSITTSAGVLQLTANPDSLYLTNKGTAGERQITATIFPSPEVAKTYALNLAIAPKSKTSSVVVLTLKNSNNVRGKDFLNALIDAYNRDANDYKNEVAEKTGSFIDSRIQIIDKELGGTEDELASFKRGAGLTDLKSDAEQALTGNAEYEKKRVENGTQISLVNDLARYINDASNTLEVLPNNIGLEDQALMTQINQYNEAIIERKRLSRTSTDNNPTIINLDTSIRAMRGNVKATLQATKQGLLITKTTLDREAGRFNRRIGDAPELERRFVNISRKQEIKSGLYLMLLQKREENAIALAATPNNAKLIGEVITDKAPISPKKPLIYLVALILGIALPMGVIYLIDLSRIKIEDYLDVENITSCPILGDLPLINEKKMTQSLLTVSANQNDVVTEAFRDIRTNALFMLDPGKKVILVTSTTSGEGKSFTSSNLAASLSLLDKKVVIVGLDIRKPRLGEIFNIKKEKGITSYLADPETDLFSLIHPVDGFPNLSVLPAGIIPPNPTELLARESLDEAIALLKSQFEYIILDTAPMGLVTDTKLIGRVASMSIYVCRADYTHKNEYELINSISDRLPNLCTLINGINLDKKKYHYYGKSNRYGSYYGYSEK